MFDGEDVTGYYNGDTMEKTFVTPFLDENLLMEIDGDSGALYFYFHDCLGSVVNVARFYKDGETWTWDDDKTNRYVYYAFGCKRGGYYDTDGDNTATDENHKKWDTLEPVDVKETWEPVNQDFEYTGRRFDDESGLMEYRARNYDPLLGRFYQIDPIGVKAGSTPKKYLYTRNNPITLIDPTGWQEENIDEWTNKPLDSGYSGSAELMTPEEYVAMKENAALDIALGIYVKVCGWNDPGLLYGAYLIIHRIKGRGELFKEDWTDFMKSQHEIWLNAHDSTKEIVKNIGEGRHYGGPFSFTSMEAAPTVTLSKLLSMRLTLYGVNPYIVYTMHMAPEVERGEDTVKVTFYNQTGTWYDVLDLHANKSTSVPVFGVKVPIPDAAIALFLWAMSEGSAFNVEVDFTLGDSEWCYNKRTKIAFPVDGWARRL